MMFTLLYNIICCLLSIDTLYYKLNRTITHMHHSLKFICWYTNDNKVVTVWQRNLSNLTLKNLITNNYFKDNLPINNYRYKNG